MSETFQFCGKTLRYLKHPYNNTSLNMRTIEVPIAMDYVKYYADVSIILEVGNVLGHYYNARWPVVDALEKGKNITNVDIMAYVPEIKPDVIVSVSTLEHIGHGRYQKIVSDKVTPAAALDHILSWLTPGGVALLTVPLGYNDILDDQLVSGELSAKEIHYMRRVNDNNEWSECSLSEAMKSKRKAGYKWSAAMAALFCQKDDKMDVLNVGCGNRIMKDAVNLDLTKHRKEIDVAHDLNVLPWPFDDNSFDKIVALAVLEHLDIDLVKSLNECHRILRPGGRVVLKLPMQTGFNAYDDPTHRWFFSLRSFDQFCPETKRGKQYSFYTPLKWKFVKKPRLNDAKSSVYTIMEVLP